MGLPFVKQFREERELTILLAIDISESGRLVPAIEARERIAELGSLLAFAANRNGDKVGLLLFQIKLKSIYHPRGQRLSLESSEKSYFMKIR